MTNQPTPANSIDPRQYLIPPALTKGLPVSPAGEIDAQAAAVVGCNVLDDELPYPLAILKAGALAHNSAWMNAFLRRFDVTLAPHGKTTMSPALFHRQLTDGAWGITAATVQQAAVMFAFGVHRVLMANQLAGMAAQRWAFEILARRPEVEFMAIVDSLEGVAALDRIGGELGATRPLPLLVELGVDGGRTGVRTIDAGVEVARAVAASPVLRLVGIEGYEAVVPADSAQAKDAAIRTFVADMGALAARCTKAGLFSQETILLSAGGSAFFDLVTALPRQLEGRPTRIVLRSGCYLTHDDGHYRELWTRLAQRSPDVGPPGEGLKPALEIWSVVQSVPEPGLAILAMGKRDVSYDMGLPTPRWQVHGHGAAATRADAHGSWKLSGLNDQHAFLRGDPGTLPAVGDRIGCSISHPCTTFDKWRVVLMVDDDYRVVDSLTTWF